jgi:cation transport protein ChaC
MALPLHLARRGSYKAISKEEMQRVSTLSSPASAKEREEVGASSAPEPAAAGSAEPVKVLLDAPGAPCGPLEAVRVLLDTKLWWEKELWVFVYGSLMWQRPDELAEAQAVMASLPGYARSFCVHSRNYRGTAEEPGLCLGLQACEGGVCEGVALRLGSPGSASAQRALALIDGQEMIAKGNTTPVYLRTPVHVELHAAEPGQGRRRVRALAYVANPKDAAPADMTPKERAELIARRRGERGPNRDYLAETCRLLGSLGIDDPVVSQLEALVTKGQRSSELLAELVN